MKALSSSPAALKLVPSVRMLPKSYVLNQGRFILLKNKTSGFLCGCGNKLMPDPHFTPSIQDAKVFNNLASGQMEAKRLSASEHCGLTVLEIHDVYINGKEEKA